MKEVATLVVLFSLLASAYGQTQKRVKLSKATAAAKISAADATGFWAQAQSASLPPAPGIVEVAGPFEADEGYARVRFISQTIATGTTCIGWQLVTPTGQTTKHEPLCGGSSEPWSTEMELFKGSFNDGADWTGIYSFQVVVQTNGSMSQVSGSVVVGLQGPLPATFTDASIHGAKLTVVGGPFVNPIVFYDGNDLGSITRVSGGFVGIAQWNPANRLLTVCDGGQCTTQVLYKVN